MGIDVNDTYGHKPFKSASLDYAFSCTNGSFMITRHVGDNPLQKQLDSLPIKTSHKFKGNLPQNSDGSGASPRLTTLATFPEFPVSPFRCHQRSSSATEKEMELKSCFTPAPMVTTKWE